MTLEVSYRLELVVSIRLSQSVSFQLQRVARRDISAGPCI